MNQYKNAARFGFESEEGAAAPAGGAADNQETIVDVAAAAGEAAEEAGEAAAAAADAAQAVADAVADAEDDNDALEQVSNAEAATDAAEGDVAQLEDSAAGLESIYDYLSDAVQNGGLNRSAAQAVHYAVEAYAAPIGLGTGGIASLESFGGDSSRLRATTMSLESIGEDLKKIWAKIWAFLQKVKDAVWNFIVRLFNAAERLKKAGEDLTKLTLNGAPANANIKMKGYARKIAVGTKVDTNPQKGLAQLTNLVKEATKYDKDLEGSADKAVEFVRAVSLGKAGDVPNVPKVTLAGYKTNNGELSTSVLPGNVRFVLKDYSFFDGKLNVYGVSKITESAKVAEDAEIPTLSPAAIKAAGEEAMGLGALIGIAKAQAKSVADKMKGKNVDISKDITPENGKKAQAALAVYRKVASLQGQMTAKVCSAAVAAAFVYVKVAQTSAREYGKKPKKAEAAAAA